MRDKILFLFLVVFSLAVNAQEIKLNQIGFYPDAQKIAIVPEAPAGNFEIHRVKDDQVVYTGTLGASNYWSYSAENVRVADFSDFSTEGLYKIVVSGIGESHEFVVSTELNTKLSKATLKAYYFNRASTALDAQYAGIYARNAGHPDNNVYIHSSASSPGRPTGSTISAPKGWYDAGDYNKYVVNSGISTYTLLAMYEHFPTYFDTLDLNIPESGNTVPDLLDEALWNIEWMLDMQDPYDGGVYHKLTTMNFSGIVMPENATNTRYVVAKSTAATLDFAAVMAVASRIYASYSTEFPGLSAQCLTAAENAWNWARNNPNVYFSNPSGFSTGGYGDGNVTDEFDWAATELYITTQRDSFYTMTDIINTGTSTPGWQNVAGLAWVSLGHHYKNLTNIADTVAIKNTLLSIGDNLLSGYNGSAYKTPMGTYSWNFVWGSNGVAGNQGLMLVQAFKINGDTAYLNAALGSIDYLLGRNPTGYCFVTGYGDEYPERVHHRPSEADGIPGSIPGFIAGGPHNGQQDGCSYPSSLPALSYIDQVCSYSTNEVTINWNAPIAYLSAAMEVLFGSPSTSAVFVSKQPEDAEELQGNSITLSVEAIGQQPISYKWRFEGVDIPGETSSSITISNLQAADTGAYDVVVINAFGSDTSRIAKVNFATQRPFFGTPLAIPGRIEAEDYDLGGQSLAYNDLTGGNSGGDYRTDNVDISGAADVGGGYNVGWTSSGEWLEYTVDVDSTTKYHFIFRVASDGFPGTIRVSFDDTIVVNSVNTPDTQGWQNWESVSAEGVWLSKGEHVMKVTILQSGYNLNYIDIGYGTVGIEEDELNNNLTYYPNPVDDLLHIALQERTIDQIKLTDLSGKVITSKSVKNNKTTLNVAEIPSGLYLLRIISDGVSVTKKIIIQ